MTVLIPSARPGPIAILIAILNSNVTLRTAVIHSILIIYFVTQSATASISKDAWLRRLV